MSSLSTVKMETWILSAYEACVAHMALSEENFSRRLADAVAEILWQDAVLDNIPPSAKDHMSEWLRPLLNIDIYEGDSLIKYDVNYLHETICNINEENAYSAIKHIIEATNIIREAAISGGYQVDTSGK